MPPDFFLRQLRRGITLVAENPHVIPTGRLTDNENDVGVIPIFRRNIGKFLAGFINELLSDDSSTCARAYSPNADNQFEGR